MRQLRVGHFGTGHTGKIALAQLLRSPRLMLSGHLVHSPDKAGRDSGEIIGLAPVGVLATDDIDAFLAHDCDCVTYLGNVSGLDHIEVVDQLSAILATGKNVVTADGRLTYPPSLERASLTKLREACDRGRSSLLGTGIAPGFATDVLPVHLASLTERPTSVHVEERLLSGTYRAPSFFALMGFGRTPEQDTLAYQPGALVEHFGGVLHQIATELGWVINDIHEFRDVAVAERDYSFPAGDVRAGTIASVRMRFEGVVAGEPRICVSFVWSLPDDLADSWEPRSPEGSTTRRLTQITIEGNPTVHIDMGVDGPGLPGSDATAARVVNAIPTVCAADPGVYGALDLVPRALGAH